MTAPTLCDIADPSEARYARGLREVFGFESARNVWPALNAGRPVLLFGWRDLYCQAVHRFPGKCWVFWRRGWSETDADGAGARLRTVLEHLRSGALGGLLWGGLGDAQPPASAMFPPVWHPGTRGRMAAASERPQIAAMGDLSAMAGAVAAAVRLGGVALLVGPPQEAPDPDVLPHIPPGIAERDEAIRDLVASAGPHARMATLADVATAHVLVRSGPASWDWTALDAIEAGCPVVTSADPAWTAAIDGSHELCVVTPGSASAVFAEAVVDLLATKPEWRELALTAERACLDECRRRFVEAAATTLAAAGFVPQAQVPSAPARPRVVLYADTPRWAQDHFVRSLGAQASEWGWDAAITNDAPAAREGEAFYSPCCGAADAIRSPLASTGLWSHVSYGGWFTDEPLDPSRLPKSRAHATNLYLHGLTGRPYLASGVDTDLFRPGVGTEDRRTRHRRDPRIVIGFTASLQYNAAVKLFHDLWVPATRAAGTGGPLRDTRFCARPLPVWDVDDARTPAEVAEYLRGVDIYLCTSLSEGCSLSVLEAAAAGCVVVSTPCGNAPELASAIVGWNAEDIARALLAYADNHERLYGDAEHTRDLAVRWWSWRAPVKAAAWRAWLAGADVPSWQEQVPYVTRGGVGPLDFLRRSRELREAAVPTLVRGNMQGS